MTAILGHRCSQLPTKLANRNLLATPIGSTTQRMLRNRRTVSPRAEAGSGYGATQAPKADSPGPVTSAANPITEIKPSVEYHIKDHVDTFNSIAIAVDDTDDAEQAVRWTIENIAADTGSQVRLLHVLCDIRGESIQLGSSPSGHRYHTDSLDVAEMASEPHRAHQRKLIWHGEDVLLRRALKDVGRAQLKYSVHTPVLNTPKSAATIAEALCEDAARTSARMLVVAVHGEEEMAHFGSVARYCCQHSKVPVMLLPAQVSERSRRVDHNVLLAVAHDHSELKLLIDFAARELVRPGDEVVVATVSDSAGGTTMVDVPEQLRQELTEAGAADVRLCELPSDAIQVMRGTPENVVTWVDETGRRLCRLAQDLPVRQVLLVNYSSQGVIAEALHGSLSSYISCNAHKPLLLLPMP